MKKCICGHLERDHVLPNSACEACLKESKQFADICPEFTEDPNLTVSDKETT